MYKPNENAPEIAPACLLNTDLPDVVDMISIYKIIHKRRA
jgi:hypothetical protein